MALNLKTKIAAIAILAAFSASILAAPAPWFLWRSKLNGQRYCTQSVPGPGWEKVGGPYKDSRCVKPGEPGYWISVPSK